MEVKRCRVDNLYFCIWHDDGVFQVKDVRTWLIWFIEAISDLNRRLEDSYIYNKEKLENGRVEVSKCKNKNVWLQTEDHSFIFQLVKTNRGGELL